MTHYFWIRMGKEWFIAEYDGYDFYLAGDETILFGSDIDEIDGEI